MGRPTNSDRQNAIDLGLQTYIGKMHVKCGTRERYVAGGGCIHCGRIIATEQREALKYLKRAAREEAVRDEAEPALDSVSESGLETEEEARARYDADIDEMM